MEVARLGSRAQREFIEAEAMDISTAMTHGGCSFQQARGVVGLEFLAYFVRHLVAVCHTRKCSLGK